MVLVDAEFRGELIGQGKADAADIFDGGVGITEQHADGLTAVHFKQLEGDGRGDIVLLQRHQHVAEFPLFLSGRDDPDQGFFADSGHREQPLGFVIHHL